jgi:hypothetical protein
MWGALSDEKSGLVQLMLQMKGEWRSDWHVSVTRGVAGAVHFCPQLGAATKNDLATCMLSVSTQEMNTN